MTTVKISDHHLNEIINAEDLEEDDYNILVKKQEGGYATKDDKCAIEKHLYKLNFNVETIDEEFMKKYYGKIHVLKNLKYILNKEKINISDVLQCEDGKVGFWNIKRAEMMDIIKDFIGSLGFDLNKINNVIIDKESFETNIKKCKQTNKLFTKPVKYRPLFELNKCKGDRLDSTKAFLGFINKILKEWGLKLQVLKKTKRIQKKCLLVILNII